MKWTIRLVWYLCLGIWALPCWLCADIVLPPTTDIFAKQDPALSETQFPSTPLVEADIRFSPGVRYDRLDWSTAGSGDNYPNILSELAWTDLYSHQWTLEGAFTVKPNFHWRGAVSFALIESGQVRDSDYDGDNRTREYSRSISETSDDYLWDVTMGIGPAFHPGKGRLMLAPLIGFSVHSQDLRITNGTQVIATPPRTPPLGPLDPALNSTFQTQWKGPWVGIDLRYKTDRHPSKSAAEFGLSLEYHFAASYSAEANWNLRSDLQHPVSFRQRAQGQGLQVSGVWSILYNQRIGLNLGLKYQYWTTSSGTISIFRSDGEILEARLNSVNRESTSFSIGVVYYF